MFYVDLESFSDVIGVTVQAKLLSEKMSYEVKSSSSCFHLDRLVLGSAFDRSLTA